MMNSCFNQMFILNAIGRLFAHCWMRGDPVSYIMATSHQLFMEISRVWLQVGVVLDGSSPSTHVQEATLCNSVRYGKPMGPPFYVYHDYELLSVCISGRLKMIY